MQSHRYNPANQNSHTISVEAVIVTEVAVQHRAAGVDLDGSAEVILGQLESLLAEVDGAQTVPGIVVAVVAQDGCPERGHRLLHVLIVHLTGDSGQD